MRKMKLKEVRETEAREVNFLKLLGKERTLLGVTGKSDIVKQ